MDGELKRKSVVNTVIIDFSFERIYKELPFNCLCFLCDENAFLCVLWFYVNKIVRLGEVNLPWDDSF